MAYSFFSLTGRLSALSGQSAMQHFLSGFQGLEKNQYFQDLKPAYLFFALTFFLNIWVIYYGIRGGIERLCKIALPILNGILIMVSDSSGILTFQP